MQQNNGPQRRTPHFPIPGLGSDLPGMNYKILKKSFISQWALNSSSQYREFFLGYIKVSPSLLLPGMLLKIPELVPSLRNPDLIDGSEKTPGHGVILMMIQG